MIRAVIFDLDGLMIDSESLSHRALNQFLSSMGCHLTEENYRHMIGLDNFHFASYAINLLGLKMTPAQLMENHYHHLLALMRTDLQPMEGLLSLLRRLKRDGMKLAVASNSPLSYVETALQIIQVRQDIDCVIGVDLVEKPKPAPDVYLAAAAGVGTAPGECIALEDSPVGMQAALAAGTVCVAIPNPSLVKADFSGALARFETLSAFEAALDTILAQFSQQQFQPVQR